MDQFGAPALVAAEDLAGDPSVPTNRHP